MSEKANTQTKGIDVVVGLLTLQFVGLKLTHYIDWSWWWVLSPVWIGFFAGVLEAAVVVYLDHREGKRRGAGWKR